MNTAVRTLDIWTQKILRLVCIILFLMLSLLLLSNVGLRLINDFSLFLTRHGLGSVAAAIKSSIPLVSFHWFDEIVELCFASLVFYGAAALWGTKGHFSVGDWLSARLPGHACRAAYKLLVSLICAGFMGVFFWYSLSLCLNSTELTTVFQIPKSLVYACMPISSGIMLCYSLVDAILDIKDLFGGSCSGSRLEQGSQSL